ncbi:MAG: fasciclin domain-containing protein [Bacteroidota bacterium]
MKKLSYLFIGLFALFTVACEQDNTDLKETELQAQIQLPKDAPAFVVELYDYLLEQGADQAVEVRNENQSVYEYLTFKPELSSFKAAVDRIPGLRLILSNGLLPVTVFVPTNEAFATFLAENGLASLDDVPQALLNQVISNHILLGAIDVEWLKMYQKTLAYADCDVRGRLNIYSEMIDPRNAIINGDVNIVRGNLFVGRSFVHVVDKVIEPSTVVDFATSDPRFSTLVEALTCPNLGIDFLGALTTEGNVFTIFAPTNDAFDKLAAELGVSSVCDIPAETLTQVLAYHVKLGASVASIRLSSGVELTTLLEGETLVSEVDGTDLNIVGNNSTGTVVIPNVQANNGVIHAIDMVLLP